MEKRLNELKRLFNKSKEQLTINDIMLIANSIKDNNKVISKLAGNLLDFFAYNCFKCQAVDTYNINEILLIALYHGVNSDIYKDAINRINFNINDIVKYIINI